MTSHEMHHRTRLRWMQHHDARSSIIYSVLLHCYTFFFLSFPFLHFFLRFPLISSFLFFSVPWLPFSLIYSRLCDTQQNYLLPLTCDGILLPSRLFVDHAESSPTGDRRSSIALANNLCLGRLRTLFSKSWGWGYVIKNITLTATVTEQNRTGQDRVR